MRINELNNILKNAGMNESGQGTHYELTGVLPTAPGQKVRSVSNDKVHDAALSRLSKDSMGFLKTEKGPFEIITDDIDIVSYADYLPAEGYVVAKWTVSDGYISGIELLPGKDPAIQSAIIKTLGHLVKG